MEHQRQRASQLIHQTAKPRKRTGRCFASVAAMGLSAAIIVLPGCGRDEPQPASTTTLQSTSTELTPEQRQVQQEQIEQLQQRFSEAISQRKDTTSFIASARQLAQQYPANSAAQIMLGQVLLFNDHHQQALEAFEAGLTLNPAQPELELLAGTVAMQLEQYESAQRHYSQAVGLEPANARYRVHLAQSLVAQQQYDAARQVLIEALKLDSNMHQAYAGLGDLYARENKLELAIQQVKRAIELTPEQDARSLSAYTRRHAALLRRANKPAESLSVLGSLPPEQLYHAAVMKEVAAGWMMLGEPSRAAQHYERALLFDPTHDLAAAEAARYYLKAGNVERAKLMVDKLRSINPRWPGLEELAEAVQQAPTTQPQ